MVDCIRLLEEALRFPCQPKRSRLAARYSRGRRWPSRECPPSGGFHFRRIGDAGSKLPSFPENQNQI